MAECRLQPSQHLHWSMHGGLGNLPHLLMKGNKYIIDEHKNAKGVLKSDKTDFKLKQ